MKDPWRFLYDIYNLFVDVEKFCEYCIYELAIDCDNLL